MYQFLVQSMIGYFFCNNKKQEYKFQTLKKVMSATGHKSGILGASYNCDGQS